VPQADEEKANAATFGTTAATLAEAASPVTRCAPRGSRIPVL